MSIKFLIGLQNPGSKYALTRHNVGAWFVEAIANNYHVILKTESKLNISATDVIIDNILCKIILPNCFVNQSGIVLQKVCKFYKISAPELLIVHDDLDLTPGTIKIKYGGGHGGHNGLRSIITHLSTVKFYRLRIGIGHPGHKDYVVDYVLSKPSLHDRQMIEQAIAKGLAVLPNIVQENLAIAMNMLHTTAGSK